MPVALMYAAISVGIFTALGSLHEMDAVKNNEIAALMREADRELKAEQVVLADDWFRNL